MFWFGNFKINFQFLLRPQILLLSGNPSHRPDFVDLGHLITKGIGLLFCGHVVTV